MSAPRELLTSAEVGEVLGVNASRVVQLLERRPDFPRPYAITPGTAMRLWRPKDIERWAATADRSVGRPARAPKPAQGTAKAAARAALDARQRDRPRP